jgi:hypothetical protein
MTSRRNTRQFRPSLDGLESRQVLSSFALARPPMVSTPVDLNTAVLKFAKSKVGTKVGDGECATLADQAVKAGGGKRFNQLGPTGLNADYIWGRKVTTLTTSGGSVASIRPGDIIQFRNVKFRQDARIT